MKNCRFNTNFAQAIQVIMSDIKQLNNNKSYKKEPPNKTSATLITHGIQIEMYYRPMYS